MNSGALLLLSSAFLHASWNAIAKTTKDKEAFLFVAMTVSNLLIAFSLLFFTENFEAGTPLIFAILSGVFEGAYFVTLAWSLKQSQLGKAYSIMRGGAMIFVWIISTIFMGETATLIQTAGAALVLAGIVVLSFPGNTPKKSADGWFAKVPWAWVCAIFIGGYHLSYHQALHHGAEPKSLFAVAMVISWPFLWFAMRGSRMERVKGILRDEKIKAIAAGVAANMSFVIFLYGLKVSVPGFAISLRNSSIFFAVIFSFILKESLTRVQLLGALIVGGGAVLLSL
ncbi:EamA family transporter [Bdellovibrio sp. HCB274]|uniref:EamA family transporter n=1 Tax=Bdellovibrio sp. HCB274 TaxID=3394361 RepID=UPI0039B3F8DB